MPRYLLTLNAGSSSIKFSLFGVSERLEALARGAIDALGGRARLVFAPVGRAPLDRALTEAEGRDHEAAMAVVLAAIGEHFPDAEVGAVGHRIVHGGPRLAAPAQIDAALYAELAALAPLAPLHQPHNLSGVRAAQALFPNAIQVGCFDTAFHHGHAFVDDAYGLPRAMFDEGIRRYGFHGLSYEYVSARLAEIAPEVAKGRVLIAHLGNGASICALREGRSVATTMGFSTLDGLPMGTRPGQLDPGVVLYLMSEKGYDLNALNALFYRRSGLAGLSGISNDWRELEAAGTLAAEDAMAYFAHRVRFEIGGLAAILGGLDALVFTGGIGEHAAGLRARVVGGLGWLGLELDEAANRAHGTLVTGPASRVRAYVVPTDEERRIAEQTAEIAFPLHLA
jgi:acetate kinase